MSTPKLESHIMAIEKSNDGLSPPPKLLISHGLPVLSGSNPQVVRNHPGSNTTSTTPPPPPQKKKKKKGNFEPPPTHKKTKQKKQGPREKMGKKRKKEGAIFANPPLEDPLVDEPLWEKARKALPTATILNEIFEFSEINICQKY